MTVLLLAFTLIFFGCLAFFCMRMRVGGLAHRGLTRGVCALWTLILCTLVPGLNVGINAVNVACIGTLGLPGLGLLAVLAQMPLG